ncbi:MAG: hypothetical protein NZT61_06765, partial [Deltaproteobacteria bacterium]|nr:hypothetical protein [Deltaproteobacteria bacterium]
TKKNIFILFTIGSVFHFFRGVDFKTVLFLPLTYSFFVHSKYINLIAISLALVLDYILGLIGFLLMIFRGFRKFRFALFFSVVSLFSLSQSLFELNKNLSQLFANFSFFTPLIFIFFRQSYFAQLCAFFSYVALPHMMLFSKLSLLKEMNSKAVVAILLVQTLISSQNLPRISTLNDGSRKIIFGVECGKLIKNHSNLCKRFKSLWDKDKRLCFNNEPFDEIKECRGRKYITLRGIAN